VASLEAGTVDGVIVSTSMTFPGTDLLGVTAGECEARVEGLAMLMQRGGGGESSAWC
jgi:hypothetical protein